MNKLLDERREEIAAACARHGVARLDVFGSAVRDDFVPGSSDVDFLVEFGPMEEYARVDAYFGMRHDLEAALGTRVDLVMAGAVKNRYIAQDIEASRQMLYAA